MWRQLYQRLIIRKLAARVSVFRRGGGVFYFLGTNQTRVAHLLAVILIVRISLMTQSLYRGWIHRDGDHSGVKKNKKQSDAVMSLHEKLIFFFKSLSICRSTTGHYMKFCTSGISKACRTRYIHLHYMKQLYNLLNDPVFIVITAYISLTSPNNL